jgi:hypothetical protein
MRQHVFAVVYEVRDPQLTAMNCLLWALLAEANVGPLDGRHPCYEP